MSLAATEPCGTGDTCCPPLPPGPLDTFEAIVRDYIRRYRPRSDADVRFMRGCASLEEALDVAGLCRNADGKRHGHQRRIPEAVLRKARLRLGKADPRRASSFADLHNLVEHTIRPIRGIGPLAVYDITHRLGCYLGLEPEEVYLHAGTKVGANALGFARARTLDPADLPRAFRRLRPHEIEDCLCIYKDELRRVAGGG